MNSNRPTAHEPFSAVSRRSLVRSLSVGVYSLLLVFTFSNGLIFFFLWRHYSAQNQQQAEWSFAENLAPRIRPYVSPEVDYENLRRVFDSVLEANLEKDAYILNAEGRIELAFARSAAAGNFSSVPLEPIRRFFEIGGRRNAPIFGMNPLTGRSDALFSVASIKLKNEPAILYVVLNNAYAQSVQQRHLTRITIFTILLSAIVAVIGALILAGFFFRPLMLRISSMMGSVRALGAGNRAARAEVSGADELGELGAAFNEMAEQVEQAVVQLESKDRLRRELIENVWHDIRGPVSALRGLAELLSEQHASTSLVQGISANAAHLSRFLDELREMSDLELHEKRIADDAVDLLDLAEELVDSFKHRAQEENKLITIQAEDSLPLVRGDAHLLSRLLQNLLENALRFTGSGGEVSIGLKQRGERLELSVSDTGMGIAKENLARVFERRFQADQDSHLRGAAGLGLSIVNRIAEAHHAELVVQSMEEKGTRFTVSFSQFGR